MARLILQSRTESCQLFFGTNYPAITRFHVTEREAPSAQSQLSVVPAPINNVPPAVLEVQVN